MTITMYQLRSNDFVDQSSALHLNPVLFRLLIKIKAACCRCMILADHGVNFRPSTVCYTTVIHQYDDLCEVLQDTRWYRCHAEVVSVAVFPYHSVPCPWLGTFGRFVCEEVGEDWPTCQRYLSDEKASAEELGSNHNKRSALGATMPSQNKRPQLRALQQHAPENCKL